MRVKSEKTIKGVKRPKTGLGEMAQSRTKPKISLDQGRVTEWHRVAPRKGTGRVKEWRRAVSWRSPGRAIEEYGLRHGMTQGCFKEHRGRI